VPQRHTRRLSRGPGHDPNPQWRMGPTTAPIGDREPHKPHWLSVLLCGHVWVIPQCSPLRAPTHATLMSCLRLTLTPSLTRPDHDPPPLHRESDSDSERKPRPHLRFVSKARWHGSYQRCLHGNKDVKAFGIPRARDQVDERVDWT
jgi:hypothetical protein